MKLLEIFGWGEARTAERSWRDKLEAQNARRGLTQTGTSATKGVWLISAAGKRLAGPFADASKAQAYKDGRPDRIPADAKIRSL